MGREDLGFGRPARLPLDAIVLAGATGVSPFVVDGQPVAKPHLVVGGETLVLRATRAALGADGVDRVFVVGDVPRLRQALSSVATDPRLELVAQGRDLIDNGYRAFFQHVLPARGFPDAPPGEGDPVAISAFAGQNPEAARIAALVLSADLPFVTSRDIEEFIRDAPSDGAFTMGLVDHRPMERMREALGAQTVLDSWKWGAFPLRRFPVRLNNFWLVRPLLADPVLYSLIASLYAHRWLLNQDGSICWRNWRACVLAAARHSRRVKGRIRFYRGVFNFVPAVMAFGAARVSSRVGDWLAWPFRQFLGQDDLEFIARLLFGVPARVHISDNIAPAIDIDVPESYLMLTKEGGEDYRRMARYLGRD